MGKLLNQSLVGGAYRTARVAILLSFLATAILVAALVGQRVAFDRAASDAAAASRLATDLGV
jgi:hypothetical protein